MQLGILKLLRERLGDFEYRSISNKADAPTPGEGAGITADTVEAINSSDLLVIGGSNLYEVSGDKWGVVVDDEALDELRTPVLLIGIGSGWSFAYPTFPAIPERAAGQIRRLHRSARGSSVRDDLTARVLERHQIGPCVVTGCPAGFLAETPLAKARGRTVGVPFLPRRMHAAASLHPGRRRSPTYERRRAITKFFLGLLRALRAEGCDARILVHDAADLPLAEKLLGSGFVYEAEPTRMLEEIAKCDVIVGFRLHACIAGMAFGVPPIPILSDGRNHAYAETMRLVELSVPIDPASVELAMERVRLALGEGRSFWAPAFARRDALRDTMRGFLAASV